MIHRLLTRVSPLALIVFVSVGLLSCAPQSSTLPAQPHRNPDTILETYSDLDLMRYLLMAADLTLASKTQEVERLRQNLKLATMRPGATRPTEEYFLSLGATSKHMAAFQAEFVTIVSMVRQYRLTEAKEQANVLLQRLPQALADREELEKSIRTLGGITGASSAAVVAKQIELGTTYEEILQRLTMADRTLRPLVEFMKNRDIEVLIRELGVTEIYQVYRALVALQPTDLSLELAPRRAFVGDVVDFWGNLTSRGIALPRRDIAVEIEGGDSLIVRSALNGYFSGQLKLPYKYDSSVAIRAHYLTKDADASLYLSAVSPLIKVESAFYSSWLQIDTSSKLYPGLSIIRGSLYGADPPLPGTRKVEIFVDGSPAGSAMVGEDFGLRLGGEEGLNPGKYRIKIVAPGQGRYGPASAEASLDVAKVTPVVELQTPRLVLIPLSFDVRGRAKSEVAPLNAARIKLKFGQNVAEVVTAADGTFLWRLSPGFFYSPIGQQELEVEVVPSEPWNKTASTKANFIVFNPVGVAFLLMVVLVVNRQLRLRRKAARNVEPVFRAYPSALALETVSASSGATIVQAREKGTIAEREREAKLLQIYMAMLSFITSHVGVMIRPHLTLREIVKKLTPRLEALSSILWRLTLIAERLIYSRHSPTEKDAEEMENLSVEVTDSMRRKPG